MRVENSLEGRDGPKINLRTTRVCPAIRSPPRRGDLLIRGRRYVPAIRGLQLIAITVFTQQTWHAG